MEINNLGTFRATVASGKTALGCVIDSPDPCITELAADCGMDFVWIDMEHAPITVPDALHHMMAIKGTNCAPFIRVPINEPWVVKQIIDLAPAGIIFPMINSEAEARAAVAACQYPADGGVRGMGVRRAIHYGMHPICEHLAETLGGNPMIILQIEHREAVGNLDSILAVPGWHSVCIGPYDLTASYGKPLAFADPEIKIALGTIAEKVAKSDKMLGGFLPEACLSAIPAHIHWRAVCTEYDALSASLRNFISVRHA